MMRPECALLGTVTIRPEALERRCDAGETLEMRAPGRAGKGDDHPRLQAAAGEQQASVRRDLVGVGAAAGGGHAADAP